MATEKTPAEETEQAPEEEKAPVAEKEQAPEEEQAPVAEKEQAPVAEKEQAPEEEQAPVAEKEQAPEEEKAPVAEKEQAPAAETAKAPVAEKEQAPAAKKETPKKAAAKTTAAKEGKSITKDELIDVIKQMTVLELSELVKALEAEFGVSAAAPVAVAAASAGAATAEAALQPEEQTEFTVTLKDIGPNKINVIKTVREVTGLGLKESKDLVESAPAKVKEGITKEEVATLKEKLEAAGATIEVK